MDADGTTSEEAPVMGAEIPRRYTIDEPLDGALKGAVSRRMSREISLDVLSHDKITLSWMNLNAYVIPGFKRCASCCDDRSVEEMGYKQLLRNGLSQVVLC